MTAPDESIALGRNRHRAGDLSGAEGFYRSALEQTPDHPDAWHLLGVIAIERGLHAVALERIERALRQRSDDPAFLLNRGIALQGLGRTLEAIEAFRKALLLRPDFPEALNNLATVLHTVGQVTEALEHWRRAISLRPDYADAHRNLAAIHMQQNESATAIAHARKAAELQPRSVVNLSVLGDALALGERHTEAAVAYRAAVALQPANASLRCRLAHVLRLVARPEDALAEAQEALRLQPDDPDTYNEAAAALGALGRSGEAEAYVRHALLLRPNDPEASCNLAVLLSARRRFAEAADLLRQALRARPDLIQASLALSRALMRQGLLDEAEEGLRQAMARQPTHAPTHAALGEVLAGQGLLHQAQAAFRVALQHDPSLAPTHSALLIARCSDPDVTPVQLLTESRQWEQQHAKASRPGPRPDHDRDTDRPLRVGYVSPDLLGHVLVKFFAPVLAHHCRGQIETICYADVLTPDAITDQLRRLALQWRSTRGLSDDELVHQVYQDRIDILVDLAGHTGNRLDVFVRQPAPLQLTWLGYPATTGLSAVHYRITDSVADPPGEEPGSSEELIRLPGCFCCFVPSADAPPVAPAPCLSRGYVTFGSTHKLLKLNDRVLDAWADVLHAVPSSRLLVYRDSLRGRAADLLRERLACRGLTEDRFELRYEMPDLGHLAIYADVDVLFDVWPWSGHATACEALWQGVPVLTLRGDRHAGRMVASVLTAVGLRDLIADTPAQYVALATRLAADIHALAALRAGLREKVRTSPLCDAVGFTLGLEAAYRQMWRQYVMRSG